MQWNGAKLWSTNPHFIHVFAWKHRYSTPFSKYQWYFIFENLERTNAEVNIKQKIKGTSQVCVLNVTHFAALLHWPSFFSHRTRHGFCLFTRWLASLFQNLPSKWVRDDHFFLFVNFYDLTRLTKLVFHSWLATSVRTREKWKIINHLIIRFLNSRATGNSCAKCNRWK